MGGALPDQTSIWGGSQSSNFQVEVNLVLASKPILAKCCGYETKAGKHSVCSHLHVPGAVAFLLKF